METLIGEPLVYQFADKYNNIRYRDAKTGRFMKKEAALELLRNRTGLEDTVNSDIINYNNSQIQESNPERHTEIYAPDEINSILQREAIRLQENRKIEERKRRSSSRLGNIVTGLKAGLFGVAATVTFGMVGFLYSPQILQAVDYISTRFS